MCRFQELISRQYGGWILFSVWNPSAFVGTPSRSLVLDRAREESMATDLQKELLASLISEIKEYQGQDPLLPWLQWVHTFDLFPISIVAAFLISLVGFSSQGDSKDEGISTIPSSSRETPSIPPKMCWNLRDRPPVPEWFPISSYLDSIGNLQE